MLFSYKIPTMAFLAANAAFAAAQSNPIQARAGPPSKPNSGNDLPPPGFGNAPFVPPVGFGASQYHHHHTGASQLHHHHHTTGPSGNAPPSMPTGGKSVPQPWSPPSAGAPSGGNGNTQSPDTTIYVGGETSPTGSAINVDTTGYITQTGKLSFAWPSGAAKPSSTPEFGWTHWHHHESSSEDSHRHKPSHKPSAHWPSAHWTGPSGSEGSQPSGHHNHKPSPHWSQPAESSSSHHHHPHKPSAHWSQPAESSSTPVRSSPTWSRQSQPSGETSTGSHHHHHSHSSAPVRPSQSWSRPGPPSGSSPSGAPPHYGASQHHHHHHTSATGPAGSSESGSPSGSEPCDKSSATGPSATGSTPTGSKTSPGPGKEPKPVGPSASARARLAKSADAHALYGDAAARVCGLSEQISGGEITACPLESGSGWDCLNLASTLESCGGCFTLGEGQDCTQIAGVESVGCIQGKCVIGSCEDGYWLDSSKGECIKV